MCKWIFIGITPRFALSFRDSGSKQAHQLVTSGPFYINFGKAKDSLNESLKANQ